MLKFIKDLPIKISQNRLLTYLVVVVSCLMTFILKFDFSIVGLLLLGVLLWQIEKESFFMLALAVLLPLFAYFSFTTDYHSLILNFTVFLEIILIWLLRKTNSWGVSIEILSIFLVVLVLICQNLFPNLMDPVLKSTNGSDISDIKRLLFGFVSMVTGFEAILISWISCRWQNRSMPVSTLLVDSACNIRVSTFLLAFSFFVPGLAYLVQVSFVASIYPLSLPYLSSAISLFSWMYKTRKIKQGSKDFEFSYIWLIFMFLCAIVFYFALAPIGLLDVGFNFRKKYQNYLNRR